MKYKAYYLGFAITFTMCILASFRSLYLVATSSFLLSCYLLLAAFYEEKNNEDGKSDN
jgi:hypothetical protein